jgi:putative two-component system response regulator
LLYREVVQAMHAAPHGQGLATMEAAVLPGGQALTSKRVYKPAFAPDIARNMIVGDSGRHFDPTLVAAFVENEDRFLAVREQFAEPQMTLV